MRMTLRHIGRAAIILLLTAPAPSAAQEPSELQKQFITSLLRGDKDLSSFVDSTDLTAASRLSITYEGIRNKFLIGFSGFPASAIFSLRSNSPSITR